VAVLACCALSASAIAFYIPACKKSRSGAAPAAVTYHADIAPIISKHCTTCHRPGETAPFALLTYDDARKHAKEMVKVTATRFMPPWLPEKGYGEFADERRLSDGEIATIARWVEAGCVRGEDRSQKTEDKANTQWKLGQPDLVATMPDPYTLPHVGKDVYRNFVVPLPLDRARWVRGVELRVGSSAVHHAFIKFDQSGTARRRDTQDPDPGYPGMESGDDVSMPSGQLTSWQPGRLPAMGSEERSWRLAKGAEALALACDR